MLLGFFLFVAACVALFFVAMFRPDVPPSTDIDPLVEAEELVCYAKG